MPYARNADLPPAVQKLPEHAQDIFRAAFNNAWSRFTSPNGREQYAHRVAWAAVKRHYEKQGGEWAPRRPASAAPAHD